MASAQDYWWQRRAPLPPVVLAILVAVFSGVMAGINFCEDSHKPADRSKAKAQHCQIISTHDVQEALQRPALTEFVSANSNSCAFGDGAYVQSSMIVQHDKRRETYKMNQRAINGEPTHVEGANSAFWGAKRSSIFVWQDGKFAAIYGTGLTELQLTNLAATVVRKM